MFQTFIFLSLDHKRFPFKFPVDHNKVKTSTLLCQQLFQCYQEKGLWNETKLRLDLKTQGVKRTMSAALLSSEDENAVIHVPKVTKKKKVADVGDPTRPIVLSTTTDSSDNGVLNNIEFKKKRRKKKKRREEKETQDSDTDNQVCHDDRNLSLIKIPYPTPKKVADPSPSDWDFYGTFLFAAGQKLTEHGNGSVTLEDCNVNTRQSDGSDGVSSGQDDLPPARTCGVELENVPKESNSMVRIFNITFF